MDKEEKFNFITLEQDEALRLDQYITANVSSAVSRSRIQQLIAEGKITVNGKPAKAHYKLRRNDCVEGIIPEAKATEVVAQDIPLDIIFEDEDILLINKPIDMVVHPAVGNYSRTLVNALLYYGCELSSINSPIRPGIVHRLDKDTSGIMVVAKNNRAHQRLARQFQKHSIERMYVAIVKGKVEFDEGIIDAPLARHPEHREKFMVSFTNARSALTKYKVVERYDGVSFLELTPHTGRTHQLRVHLKFLGHPILGDPKYSRANEFERMALHALVLGFRHPTSNEMVSFRCDIPQSFTHYLKSVK